MNSRRLIAFPEAKDEQSYRFTSAAMHKIDVKYQAHVLFAAQTAMSALPLKVDIGAAFENVR
jgi:hypothetical protein